MGLENVKIDPSTVTWGESAVQVETIVCAADVADSLDGKYFFIYNSAGTKFHVWYNTSGGAAVDPAPGGSTAAVVAITTGDTANAVATATEAVIEALTGFASTVSNATVTVTHDAAGYIQAAHEGVGTGFTFAVTTEGETAVDLGLTQDSFELQWEEKLKAIVAQQYGDNELSDIRVGKSATITVNLLESHVTQMKRMLRQAGGSFTPAGAGGTEVTGLGTYKDGTQTLNQSRKLVLHPRALGVSDKSSDWTAPLAYPMLSGIALSGNSETLIPVEFKLYPKLANNSRAQLLVFGDGSQTLT